METMKKNTIFTNVALTSDGGVYWEGLENEIGPGVSITSWMGEKEWSPNTGNLAAHSNSRFVFV